MTALTKQAKQQSQAHVWAFGPYTLDGEGHLSLGPSAIPLSPLQRRLLLSLVRHAGHVLEKDTLLQEVWGHTQVSDVSLARAVHGLRRILERGPLGAGVIRTIYGSGYRFDVCVSQVAARQTMVPASEPVGFPSSRALSHFVEGLVQVRHRDPQQLTNAAQHFRHCLASHPEFAPAQVQLAATLLAQFAWGQLSAASIETEVEALLRQAEASGVVSDEVRGLRVEVLSLLNWQPQLAETRFASWLPEQLAPGAPRHGWVRHLLATGRPAEALALLTPELRDDTPSGWFLAGLSQLQLGLPEDAITMLRTPLRLDPSLAAPRWLLALSLAQAGKGTDALQVLAKCRLAGSQPVSLQAAPALVLALSGEEARAAGLLATLLRGRDASISMTSLWGLVALTLGDEAAASRLLDQAVTNRCGLAPFLWNWQGGQRHQQSPAWLTFQERMQAIFQHQLPLEADAGVAA